MEEERSDTSDQQISCASACFQFSSDTEIMVGGGGDVAGLRTPDERYSVLNIFFCKVNKLYNLM